MLDHPYTPIFLYSIFQDCGANSSCKVLAHPEPFVSSASTIIGRSECTCSIFLQWVVGFTDLNLIHSRYFLKLVEQPFSSDMLQLEQFEECSSWIDRQLNMSSPQQSSCEVIKWNACLSRDHGSVLIDYRLSPICPYGEMLCHHQHVAVPEILNTVPLKSSNKVIRAKSQQMHCMHTPLKVPLCKSNQIQT